MSGTAIVNEIISILTAGISSLATAIGTGLSNIATSVFLTGTGENQTLSVFGVLIVVFAGLALCIGLCMKVVDWLSTLGGARM